MPGDIDDKADNKVVNGYWLFCVMPVHTVCKVVLKDNSLKLYFPDVSQIKRIIDNKETTLKYVKSLDENSNYIFVSPPDDWMSFLAKHGNNEEVFPTDNILEFEKKQ